MAMVLGTGDAEGKTITVDDDGGEDHKIIQEAIDAAEEGDIVQVYDGVYKEALVIDKPITLSGQSPENTEVRGKNDGDDAITVTADHVNITSIGIVGYVELNSGIKISSSYCKVNSVSCEYYDGYGIFLVPGSSNNTITGNRCIQEGIGIYLNSSFNNTLTENDCKGDGYDYNLKKYGILLEHSGDNIIAYTGCRYGLVGIILSDSHRNEIYDSDIYSLNEPGIVLSNGSSRNEIWANTMYDLHTGIHLTTNSAKNIISNNEVYSMDYGIILDSSFNNTLSGNDCSDSFSMSLNRFGIYLKNSDYNILLENTCNNNNYGIYTSGSCYNFINQSACNENKRAGISLLSSSEYNVVFKSTCESNLETGIRVSGSWNTIEENSCEYSPEGIHIDGSIGSADYCLVVNNTVTENSQGIKLSTGANYNTLRNNLCFENRGSGISNHASSNNLIEGNQCNANDYHGIYFWLYSEGNTARENQCFDNGDFGIHIYQSKKNTLESNIIHSNDKGIVLDSPPQGYSQSNKLYDNNIYQNIDGIQMEEQSNSNTIKYNRVHNNTRYGIYLHFSRANTFQYNNICDNQRGMRVDSNCLDAIKVNYNNIYGNTEYGLNASSNGQDVDGKNNWWGDGSGPYHPEDNPGGTGDNVTEWVSFNPWCDSWVNIPPTASLDALGKYLFVEGEGIIFKGTGSDRDGEVVSYRWRSDIDDVFYRGPDEQISCSNLSSGNHTVFFSVRDDGGSWSDERSLDLYINGRPVVVIVAVEPGQVITGESVSFKANATDEHGIVCCVWVSSIDGEIHNDTGANFTVSNLSVGAHTVTFKALDNLSAWSEELTATLVVTIPDSDPPTISISSPADGDTVKENITITGAAADNVGVVSIEYRVAGTGAWLPASGTNSWSTGFDTTTLEDGEHVLEFRASDGNQYSGTYTLTIKVNNHGTYDEKEQDDSITALLFEEIGPLPVVGYIGILGVGVILGVVLMKKRKRGDTGKPAAPAHLNQQQPFPQQPPGLGPGQQFPTQQQWGPVVQGQQQQIYSQMAPPQQVPQPLQPTGPPQYQQQAQWPQQQQTATSFPQPQTSMPDAPQQPVPLRQIPPRVQCPKCSTVIQVDPMKTTPDGKVHVSCSVCGTTGNL